MRRQSVANRTAQAGNDHGRPGVNFEGGRHALRVVKPPSQGVGIRKMIVDAQGQRCYMGSHNGRLGRMR